ncbi:MAG: substrate-binding domain-containing protein [Lachnospiraceae bacterium]|nr:substrate-binding domain-containing protein [Lachnospiraceae bacterium]
MTRRKAWKTIKKKKQLHARTEAPERKFSGLTFLPLFLTAACILFTVVMAGYILWFYKGSFQEETAGETYDRYYIMITQDGKSAFWQSVYQGAYERALQENVYVDWLGNDHFQDYSVEEQMEIAIAAGVDGIIVTASEEEEMTTLIDRADAVGIPVVTLYGDNTQSARCSFVGVGSYNLGREYGRQALKIMRERLVGAEETRLVIKQGEDTGETGDAIALGEAPGGTEMVLETEETEIGTSARPIRVTLLVNPFANSLDQNILYSGIQETIEQERGNTVVELSQKSVDDTNAFSVEESVRDIFMGGDIPDILICLNELNTTCAYQAVVDYNKVGEVSILGHYVSDTILNAIDRSVIYATVDIDTAQMGAFCIDALQEYHDLGYTSQYFTADISLVTRDNVDEYLRGEEAENAE